MGCYDASLAFLHRIGASNRVRRQSGLAVTMVEQGGRQSRLQLPPLPAPLHLLAGVLAWDALSWAEKLSVMRVGTAITARPATVAPDAQPRRLTVREWLMAHGQAPRLVGLFWEPLALAALNQSIDDAAAATFVEVLCAHVRPGGGPRVAGAAGGAAGRDVRRAGARSGSRREDPKCGRGRWRACG